MQQGRCSGNSQSGAHSLHLYSAGHDGCIVSTHVQIFCGSSVVVAQQRVRNLYPAPIVAFNLTGSEGSCFGNSPLNFISVQNGRVMYSSGTFSMPSPPTAIGIVDHHRFSALAAACLPSAIVLADICKGQVRAMTTDPRAGCHRIIPGMHSDTINEIAFVCFENAHRNPADPPGRGIVCTVSTDGCCCICSIPASIVSSADEFYVLTRLHADAHLASGSALMCVRVVWLGNCRALVVTGGAFSCVHVWLLHFYASDNGGHANVDVVSHASHSCNSCDDEGKCVSAIHCTEAFEHEISGSSLNGFRCCIYACLNDGRVLFLSCLVSSQGSMSILRTQQSSIQFSHAVLCVAADSVGRLFFGLSNGCLHHASIFSPLASTLDDTPSSLSFGHSFSLSSAASFCSSMSTFEPPPQPSREALHFAGLNALLSLEFGFIMCGGEDGCLSLVRLSHDGRLSVHDTRRVSDSAVKKLLLLRRKTLILEHTVEVEVGVICHNQRALVISAQLHGTTCATSNDSITAHCDLGASRHSRITSVSTDSILDVGKSWTACLIGAVHEDDTIDPKLTPVVVGGWGVQVIHM
jgi:hypothetical protein